MIWCPHCGGNPDLTKEEVEVLRFVLHWDDATPVQQMKGKFWLNYRDFIDHDDKRLVAQTLKKMGLLEPATNARYDLEYRVSKAGFAALGFHDPNPAYFGKKGGRHG